MGGITDQSPSRKQATTARDHSQGRGEARGGLPSHECLTSGEDASDFHDEQLTSDQANGGEAGKESID